MSYEICRFSGDVPEIKFNNPEQKSTEYEITGWKNI